MLTCRLPSGKKSWKYALESAKPLIAEKKLRIVFYSGVVRLSWASNIFTKQLASDDEPNKIRLYCVCMYHITQAFHVIFSSHSMQVEPTQRDFDILEW